MPLAGGIPPTVAEATGRVFCAVGWPIWKWAKACLGQLRRVLGCALWWCGLAGRLRICEPGPIMFVYREVEGQGAGTAHLSGQDQAGAEQGAAVVRQSVPVPT